MTLKGRSVSDLQTLAGCGGSFTIDGAEFAVSDLQNIVSCGTGKSIIFVENSARFSTRELCDIAASSTGTVVFA